MARACDVIQADIDATRARLQALMNGTVLEEGGYAGHKARFKVASPEELRRHLRDLEQEQRDAGCPGAVRGGGIRVGL